ncbi:Synaptic vesicle 2-related protein [Araneus ventricosus]|uniref:Synaptic vesicle 2-related protein n=1 Tax=Araneus ventricosus TaxID=182803 RepID=A0A4Y2A986_ARAVE|nr:Synaptic vesicle 2-related protein [Araneus ventricosus]
MGRKHWTQLRRLLKERKKTINWDLDGKDWFLFGESGANYVSSFLTLNCWLLFGTILADVVGWVVPYGRRFATAFSYYGIALVSPIIIQEGSLSAIMNNPNETHFGDMQNVMPCTEFTSENFIDLLWTSAAEFPGLILFTILVERCNRKVLLSTTCIIGSVLVMLLLLNTQNIITLSILFAARGILLADFQLIFVVTSETYPTTIRSVGMGFGSSWCRIGGLIVPYVAQVLVVESPVGAMCLIGGVLFLAGVACMFLPFETRGMKMKEVQ